MGNLYDDDILLWSEQQAELLRRLARGERVNDALDFEHLIDEVECVGRSEFQAVESLLDVALTHLMAAHAAGRPEPVPHWLAEVRAALARAARRATPSMLPRLDLQDLWALARDSAADKLAADGGPARPLPQPCPFTAAELLNRKPDVDALLARLAAA
jgi:uncharacterized protein DUF29